MSSSGTGYFLFCAIGNIVNFTIEITTKTFNSSPVGNYTINLPDPDFAGVPSSSSTLLKAIQGNSYGTYQCTGNTGLFFQASRQWRIKKDTSQLELGGSTRGVSGNTFVNNTNAGTDPIGNGTVITISGSYIRNSNLPLPQTSP